MKWKLFAAVLLCAVLLASCGVEGPAGADGKDAYTIAVENGFSGSEAEWLESLHGADGKDGRDGMDGADGIDGKDGRDGIDGKDGADGRDGIDGKDGKSAYELAVEYGYDGTLEDFVALLLNRSTAVPAPSPLPQPTLSPTDAPESSPLPEEIPTSPTPDGSQELLPTPSAAPAPDNSAFDEANTDHSGDEITETDPSASYIPVPGKSAYEIAVDHHYMGTEEEWLASLQGTKLEISSDGYWVIDGVQSSYAADGASKADAIEERLSYLFRVEETFELTATTCPSPSWSYTTSTFSGWGGSIGTPASVDTIRFRVRARDTAITKIKVFLSAYDKNGAVLYEETIPVNIQPRQDAWVNWTLPQEFQNTDALPLYFSYNCDQLCDVWSDFSRSYIPEDQYQAVQTYTTDGRQLNSPQSMVNVAGSPCRYLYVQLGHAQQSYVFDIPLDTNEDFVNVFLPDEYDLVVGDNFQLFYRGVVQAVNPYNYHIRVVCSNGSAYPRYFEWTPTEEDVGRFKLTMQVYDNNHNLLGEDSATLVVTAPAAPTRPVNVLCVGDSLTAGGVWPGEMYRRLGMTGGVPAGNGFENIHFVGRKSTMSGAVGYEGTGGWTWQTYLSEKSPLYDPAAGQISFAYYCSQNNIETVDAVYFLLTWNGQGTPFKTSYTTSSGHFKDARQLIDILHSEYPNAIVRCLGLQMPSQNGGMGTSYGAAGSYSDAYGMLVTAMHYNATLEDMCQLEQYKDFVRYIDTAGQFDTDYNMPSKQKNVNNRSTVQETLGTNGVHPSNAGYYQIADAAYRAFCRDIQLYYQEP